MHKNAHEQDFYLGRRLAYYQKSILPDDDKRDLFFKKTVAAATMIVAFFNPIVRINQYTTLVSSLRWQMITSGWPSYWRHVRIILTRAYFIVSKQQRNMYGETKGIDADKTDFDYECPSVIYDRLKLRIFIWKTKIIDWWDCNHNDQDVHISG